MKGALNGRTAREARHPRNPERFHSAVTAEWQERLARNSE